MPKFMKIAFYIGLLALWSTLSPLAADQLAFRGGGGGGGFHGGDFHGGDFHGGDYHGGDYHGNWNQGNYNRNNFQHDDWNKAYNQYRQDRNAYDAGLNAGAWDGGGTTYVEPYDLDDVEQYANPDSALQQNYQYNQQQNSQQQQQNPNPLQDLQYQPQ